MIYDTLICEHRKNRWGRVRGTGKIGGWNGRIREPGNRYMGTWESGYGNLGISLSNNVRVEV
jgi:hypothetical protein